VAQGNSAINSSATSNSGTLNVSGGDLTLNQSGTSPTFSNTGTILIAAGRTFTLSGGVLTNLSGGTLSGGTYDIAGTFQFPGAAITTNAATIVLDGPGAQMVDEANKNALATFAANAAGGSFTVQDGQDFATPVAFGNAGVLVVGAGSRFTAAGGLTNFASGTLTGGTFVVAGILRFPGADIRTNAAALVLDGPAARITDLADNDALANFAANAAAGSFAIQNGSSLTVGAFSNAGSLIIGSGSTFPAAGDYTQNSGDTILATGASLASGGTVNILAGRLSGSGTIIGNVVNAGQFNPVGILTIRGNYTQTASGTLNIQIGGTTAGTDYDQLIVTGLTMLDGTLNVSVVNGFMPNLDDRFQILIFGSRTGDFAAENGLDLGNGLRFDPQYGAGSLTLVTIGGNVPPPGGGVNLNGSRHFRAWDEADFCTLPENVDGSALRQDCAIANKGNTPRACLDSFFQLLAETAGNGRAGEDFPHWLFGLMKSTVSNRPAK